MQAKKFRALMDSLSGLSASQLRQLTSRVVHLDEQRKVQDMAAKRIEALKACPLCGHGEYVKWGQTSGGDQRFKCKGCACTFSNLTGTPFNRLHHKSKLLENAECMQQRMSVRKVAERLGVHRNTAFRLRHKMMPMLAKHQPAELQGIAEADEAFFRLSYKGQKKGIPRKSYKRGMRASARGLSKEQVPVLTAISRGSRSSLITVFPAPIKAADIEAALGPVLKSDTVLVSDSATAYRAAAKSLGVVLRQIPSGSRKLGPYHIQNANALHSRMKEGLHPFRGVATKYLPLYLAWFRFFDKEAGSVKPHHFLLDALGLDFTNTN